MLERSDTAISKASMRESKEFIPRHWTIPELTSQGACDRLRVLLLDAAHHHAEMNCFDDDPDPTRVQHILNGLRYLLCKPLLHLQSARKDFNYSRQLGQPDNLSIRNVRDVSLSKKRKHVVLTHRVQLNIAHNNHVFVRLVENRIAYDVLDSEIITPGEPGLSPGNTLGCLEQPVAGGVLAQQFELPPNQIFILETGVVLRQCDRLSRGRMVTQYRSHFRGPAGCIQRSANMRE